MSEYLYRYRCLNQYSISELKNSELYFSSPKDFNDPFDCKSLFTFAGATDGHWRVFLNNFLEHNMPHLTEGERKSQIENVIRSGEHREKEKLAEHSEAWCGVLQEVSNQLGIVCLSKKQDDILMWSHYANKHYGFCLKFDRNILERQFYCGEINYKDDYPTFAEFVESDLTGIANTFVQTKSSHWKYEEECRLIVEPNNRNDSPGERLFPYKDEALVGVIFGCQMSEEDKKIIKNTLKNKPSQIEFTQAKRASNSYQLCIETA